MAGVNKAILLGNLGADPELRFTQSGQAVLNLRLATTETYLDKDNQKKERTEWHSVTVWGNRAEALSKILAKGSQIYVEGRIQTSSYDDREGVKRYKTEVVALNIELLGRRDKTDGDPRPAARPQQQRPAAQRAPVTEFDFGGDGAGDDEIPF